ncbi:YigZ family protein [Halobellus sp. Atlit-31R]|nr:YigZ family protein [Halobellus sp. Atlit-31R]
MTDATGGDADASDSTDAFRTVAEPGESRFEVKGSEFIGYVAPANTVAEAESFVAQIRERHPDATHNVPAYRVPAAGERGGGSDDPPRGTATMLREYQSDDGEPSGSSGKPALNVLIQREIRNVAAVVTRYYGGTNLGVGGLARAYSRAVKDAVDDAGVVETVPHERFAVTVAYDDSGTVRGLLESAGAEFDAAYDADVSFEVRASIDEAADIRDRIRSATSGRAEIE